MLFHLWKFSNLPFLLVSILLALATLMPAFQFKQAVYQVQITFDISQSMNVEDVSQNQHAVSRLTLAKAAARTLVLALPCGSKIGWSVFAGHRVITLLTPREVCSHHAGLIASLQQIDGRMRWVEASSVGKGLHQSMRAAQAIGEAVHVVFISDGHEAPPLRHGQRGMPDTTRLDVDGLIVGVGGNQPVPIPKTDRDGRIIGFWQANEVIQQPNVEPSQSHEELSQLFDDHLIKLAQLSGLSYQALESQGSISAAIQNDRFSVLRPAPLDLRWLPATMALLILLWRFVPDMRPKSRLKTHSAVE